MLEEDSRGRSSLIPLICEAATAAMMRRAEDAGPREQHMIK